MTEMDALRLRLAASAYRATKPSEQEVERGVRRALSAMRRSQIRRRKSFTPAIVVAVLAFATLAYANPSNVRRWMTALLGSTSDVVDREVAERLRAVRAVRPAPAIAPAPEPSPVQAPASEGAAPSAEASQQGKAGSVTPAAPATPGVRKPSARSQRATWAEVNSALASQDTVRALGALGDLSRHGDLATRAKAQLGIAQLLWSRGDRVTACSIARSLSQQKNAPQRVQERARALLESCAP